MNAVDTFLYFKRQIGFGHDDQLRGRVEMFFRVWPHDPRHFVLAQMLRFVCPSCGSEKNPFRNDKRIMGLKDLPHGTIVCWACVDDAISETLDEVAALRQLANSLERRAS